MKFDSWLLTWIPIQWTNRATTGNIYTERDVYLDLDLDATFMNLPFHFEGRKTPVNFSKIFTPEVNQKLEQCAEDCIAKLLKSLAVRNQDRSSRLLDGQLVVDSLSCFLFSRGGGFNKRGVIRMATQKIVKMMLWDVV